MKKKTKTTKKTAKPSSPRPLLIAGLLGSLVIASAGFMLFGPAPLRKAQPTLMVADPVALYNTQSQLKNWGALYIHHTKTLNDELDTRNIGDHFVIGNGNTVGDGEIVMTSQWLGQREGFVNDRPLDSGWISVALEGDFDQTPPTPAQLKWSRTVAVVLASIVIEPSEPSATFM